MRLPHGHNLCPRCLVDGIQFGKPRVYFISVIGRVRGHCSGIYVARKLSAFAVYMTMFKVGVDYSRPANALMLRTNSR